jgi:hypothetical protein
VERDMAGLRIGWRLAQSHFLTDAIVIFIHRDRQCYCTVALSTVIFRILLPALFETSRNCTLNSERVFPISFL